MRRLQKSRNIVDSLRSRINATLLKTVFLLNKLGINHVLAVFTIPVLSELISFCRLEIGFHGPEVGTQF